MKKPIKIAIALTAGCFIAAFLIFTHQPALSKTDDTTAARSAMPDADSFELKTEGGTEYFKAYRAGKLIGYCIKVTAEGYAGPIDMLAGVKKSGRITNLIILDDRETPGIGARINEAGFLKQFQNKPASDVAAKKGIDAITGATISSGAVIETVGKTVSEFLSRHQF